MKLLKALFVGVVVMLGSASHIDAKSCDGYGTWSNGIVSFPGGQWQHVCQSWGWAGNTLTAECPNAAGGMDLIDVTVPSSDADTYCVRHKVEPYFHTLEIY